MKKVIIGIKPIMRIHVRNNGAECVYTRRIYNGSVWGTSIRVNNHSFDIYDDMGYIVYTGDVRDLHSRLPDVRTFGDDDLTEFDYAPVEDCYVGF